LRIVHRHLHRQLFSSEILSLLILPFKWGTGTDTGLISTAARRVSVKLKSPCSAACSFLPLIAAALRLSPRPLQEQRQALFLSHRHADLFVPVRDLLLLLVAIRFFYGLAA
jgi:hypothetical protein